MFSRILSSTLAAAAVLAATPAIANEPAKGGDAQKSASCSERGTTQMHEPRNADATNERVALSSEQKRQQLTVGDDPSNRSQDAGG